MGAVALFEAVENCPADKIALPQLGSDYKIAQLRKDPLFKNEKLLDLIKRYEDVFELVPDDRTNTRFAVRLQPGAAAALLDDEEINARIDAEALLPQRIEDPVSVKDKIQALRIELIHALHRRGGRSPMNELLQEPRIQ